MLRQRTVIVTLLLLLWTGFLAGCGNTLPDCTDPLGCVTVRPNQPLQIGYLLPLSGPASVLGEDLLRGIELAVADRNGELMGHPISLQAGDDGCSAAVGQRSLSLMLADDAVLGIIGPGCSDVARTLLPAINNAGVLTISPSATAADLMEDTAAPPFFFRTAPSRLTQARVAAEFAYTELGLRTAVTLQDGSETARTLQQQFAQSFQQLGGRILFQGSLSAGESNVSDVLTALLAEQPDVLYAPVFAPEANHIVNRLAELNHPTILIGADTVWDPMFPLSAGTAVDGMYLTATAVTGASYDAFVTRYQVTFGTEPSGPYHAHAYDATALMLTAIELAAVENNNGGLMLGRQALRDALLRIVNFEGETGLLACNEAGQCAAPTVGVYQMTVAEANGRNWPPPLVWMPEP